MDGNALIITVAMCFFWNLRGCSLVEYIELELITSCAARYVVTGLGWVAVSITLMFSC